MRSDEIALMAAVEDDHWWYRGLRDLLARLLSGPFRVGSEARVLDAGCGTGANLRLLDELLKPSYLGGFDASEEALEWSRRKAPRADLYQSDLRNPDLRTDSLDLVVSCDALCIPGLEESSSGLRRLVSSLRPGGLLLLHLPAFDWLRGEHDLAVAIRERYSAPRIEALFDELELRRELLSYRLFWLFPSIVAVRLSTALRRRRAGSGLQSDLRRRQGTALERVFLKTLFAESKRIANGGSFPWGSSLVAIGRRVN